uniref:Methyltransferase-like protein 15 homolog n=1 Tax=Hirondellea gigas TaxID=1518452 RepID=A0A2P2HWY4_9CRUS
MAITPVKFGLCRIAGLTPLRQMSSAAQRNLYTKMLSINFPHREMHSFSSCSYRTALSSRTSIKIGTETCLAVSSCSHKSISSSRNALQRQSYVTGSDCIISRCMSSMLPVAAYTCNKLRDHQEFTGSDSISRRYSSTKPVKVSEHQAPPPCEGLFLQEILDALLMKTKEEGGVILDMTLGTGAHSDKILKNSCPKTKVIAIDRDPETKKVAEKLIQKYPGRFVYFNVKFSGLVEILSTVGVGLQSLSGAVMDLGVSQDQLTQPNRGAFHNSSVEPLDLRMDGTSSGEVTALQVLRHIDDDSLYRILKIYGQSKVGRKIAAALMKARYEMVNIRTPKDLNNVIMILMGKDPENSPSQCEDYDSLTDTSDGIHSCAASVFQALRIFVNNEVNELDCGLLSVHRFLKAQAPLAVITYNSLEDTIVKRHFTGINLDASVSSIGRPQHHHAKLVGLTQQSECKPWIDLDKHLLHYKHRQELLVTHSHWKNAKLRVATMNPDVSYSSSENLNIAARRNTGLKTILA